MLHDPAGRRRLFVTGAVCAGLAAALVFAAGRAALACTTVCIDGDRPVVAYNYDFHPSEGLLLVNQRGVTRRSAVSPGGAVWTSRHGSVTFNQFGRDNPTTGMNERGLMVSLMWLDGTKYPPADARPVTGILEWIQYHLDRDATVAEVIGSAGEVRPTSPTPIHYLFADATGDVAVVEFLGGKLVVHRGANLPVRALANDTYEESVRAYEAAKRAGTIPPSRGSLDRFVRGAMLAAKGGDPVARGFEVLASVANPGYTRWSVVYDLGNRVVNFKTDTNQEIRRLRLGGLDFACGGTMKMLDVTTAGSGDVAGRLVPWTRAANRALIEASFDQTPFLRSTPPAERESAAAHADETSTCAGR